MKLPNFRKHIFHQTAVGWLVQAVGWCRIWRYTREMLIKQLSLDFTGESPPESRPFLAMLGMMGMVGPCFSLWFFEVVLISLKGQSNRYINQWPWGLGGCQTNAQLLFFCDLYGTWKLGHLLSPLVYTFPREEMYFSFSLGFFVFSMRKFSQGLVRLLMRRKPCWMCKSQRKWCHDDNLSGDLSTGWI